MPDRSVTVFLRANVDGLIAGYEKASLATRDLAKTTETAATEHKKSWDKAGSAMLITGGVLAAGVAIAVASYAEFDHTMSTVKANIDDKTAPSMQRLSDAALKAGRDTMFSATQAAQAENELAKAGLSSAEITGGALVGALDLASAGQIDLASAAEIAATAMTQFHLSAKDVPHIADLLAAGADKALGGVTDLAESLKYSGVVAAQFGVSIEETVGTLAMFAMNGLLGSTAGTGFREMLVMMAKPTAQADDVMKKYNITMFDTKGNFKGMAGMAEELKTKLAGLTQQQREQALVTMFGMRALAEANILYGAGAAGVKEWTAKVNDQGFAAMQASTKLNNLSGDMTILKASINVALIKEGAAGNGVLRDMAHFATGAVNAFADMPAPLQSASLELAALGAVGLIAIGGFVTLVPRLVETSKALDAVTISGVSAKSALVGVGKAAGTLIAIAAVADQLSQYAGKSYVATVETKKLSGALTDLAKGGKSSAEFQMLFVNQGAAFGDTVHNNAEAMTRFGTAAAGALKGDWQNVLGRLQDSTRVPAFTKQVNQLDAALTSMAQGGQGAAATKVFTQLSNAMTKQGLSVTQVAESFPLYSAAVTGAGKDTKAAAMSADDLARANAKTAQSFVGLVDPMTNTRINAGSTGSAMLLLGKDADAASDAVKALAKVIQTDMDAASKALASDTNVLGSYDPAKQANAVAAAQDALNKARKAGGKGTGVSDAQSALGKAQQDQVNASLSNSYKTAIADAGKFATDIAAVTAKGLDPNVVAKLLQEGPAKAEPALQAMLSGNSSKMIRMVNDGERALAAINARVIEQARLTAMATNSSNDQMSKDWARAMEIDNAIATSGGKATAYSLAAQLHIGAGDVKRIAAEYGIGLADGISPGVAASKKKIDELQAKIDSIRQGKVPGLDANPKAAQAAIDALQAQIDAIKQGKKPGLNANADPGIATVNSLQTQIDRIRQGKQPGLNANSAAAQQVIRRLQEQIDSLTGKTVQVKIQWANSAYSISGINPATHLPVGFAGGGPIEGVGTGTSDSNLILGSKGEHMLTADDVAAAGGHAAIFAFRKQLHAYAGGGPIVIDMPNPSGVGAGLDANVKNVDITKMLPAFPTGGGTSGANQALGLAMMLASGWGMDQWPSLKALWTKESGWSEHAKNPSSGAYGIPQSLPANKMASAGADYLTNSATQIRWGLGYIGGRYGSPMGAMAHEQVFNWYGNGTGNAAPGWAVVGDKGPELMHMRGGEIVLPSKVTGSADLAATFGKDLGADLIRGLSAGADLVTSGSVTKIEGAFGKITEIITAMLAASKKNAAVAKLLTGEALASETKLKQLADSRDALLERTKTATDALQTLVKQSDDYAAAVASKQAATATLDSLFFSSLGPSLANVEFGMKTATQQAKDFKVTIDSLSKMGLNKSLLDQVIGEGADKGGQLGQAILDGGKGAVERLNGLQTDLTAASAGLGKSAADNLYGAGVQAAQGLVAGLQSQQADIEKVMLTIATSMQSAIKTALGIKSPSTVMRGLGRFTGQGMALGMADTQQLVVSQANLLAAAAVPTFRSAPRYAQAGVVSGLGGGIDYDRLAQAVSRVQIRVETSVDGRPLFTTVRAHSIKEARDSITGKSGLA